MHCPLLTDLLDHIGPLGPTHIPTDHSDSDNLEIREKLGKTTTEILSNKKTEYMVSYVAHTGTKPVKTAGNSSGVMSQKHVFTTFLSQNTHSNLTEINFSKILNFFLQSQVSKAKSTIEPAKLSNIPFNYFVS